MYICRLCGKQNMDGEVCNCQGNVQQLNPQMNAQPAQQMSAQQVNSNMSQVNVQQMGSNMNGQQMNNQGNVTKLLSNVFTKPVTAVAEYVTSASLMESVVVIIILSILSVLSSFLTIIGFNIEHPSINYYSAWTVIKSLTSSGCSTVISCVLLALSIFLATSIFDSKAVVSFKEAMAIASLAYIITIPIGVVGSVISLVPLNFFEDVASWMRSFGMALSTFYVFFGLRAVSPDENKHPVLYACACVIVAVGGTIIGLLFK